MNLRKFYKIHRIPAFVFWRIVNFNEKTFYAYQFCAILRQFLLNLFHNPELSTKTSFDSLNIYESYDAIEQIVTDSPTKHTCLLNGKLKKLTASEIREEYLISLYKIIDKILENNEGHPIKILEVGAGNCINLVRIKKRYGKSIKLYGGDFSSQRLIVAKDYFKNQLDDVELVHLDLTQRNDFPDDEFDLVFSMHVLEQISYDCLFALKEIKRVAKHNICLIEPILENGNYTQRLYLFYNDHVKILKKCIQHLWQQHEILCCETLHIQGTPMNQSSIVVIKQD